MQIIRAASLIASGECWSLRRRGPIWVPPFQGNDTGGIIAYQLASRTDARQLAVDHCAVRQGGEIPGGRSRNMAATFPLPAAGCPMAPTNGR